MNCTPCENILVLNVQSHSTPFFPLFHSIYLLSWPPRSSPWSSCGRQQPGQWAAPADTQPGQQLPTEPPGGMRCSDLKQRAEGERGQRRESLIIHSCRAKIRAQLSPLYPSPLFRHLTILLLESLVIKILNYPDCRTTKAQHDDTDDDYCHHHLHHHHIHSILGLTFTNRGTVGRKQKCMWTFELSKIFFTSVQLRHLSLSIESRWQITYQAHMTVLSFHSNSNGTALRGCWHRVSHPLPSASHV